VQARFPGFDVLAHVDAWDSVTAEVVLARLAPPAAPRFFTSAEQAAARALVDLLLGQHTEPRIPVVEMIDARLVDAQTDGWHYVDLPEDGQAWRDSLAALNDDATAGDGITFAACPVTIQTAILQRVQDSGSDTWHGMRADHVWSMWIRYACTAFYSHPWAWNEIGFLGPAYPRGYKNTGVNRREPSEVRDQQPVDPTRRTP
jgi:hypothetical protein